MNAGNGESSEALSREQVSSLLTQVIDKRRKALLAFGLGTGIKMEEVAQINNNVLHAEKNVLQVWDSEMTRHRTIYVPNSILTIALEFEQTNTKDGAWFPYSVQTLKNGVPPLIKEIIGIPKTWQALRRTFVKCSWGVLPPEVIKENVGESYDTVFQHAPKFPVLHSHLQDPFRSLISVKNVEDVSHK